MAASLENFTSEKKVGSVNTILVSTTGTEKKFIGKATFTNTSVLPVEVRIWRIATASTPTTTSGGNWLDVRTIQPGKVWEADKLESQVLGNSMSVYALAGTASVINADLSGVTES